MKKIFIISEDNNIINYFLENINDLNEKIILSKSSDPLEIFSQLCLLNPYVILIDDDFTKPNSTKILKSIKKVKPNLSIVFLTSDNTIKFGRAINSIGVTHYLIKPVIKNNFNEYIKSICK